MARFRFTGSPFVDAGIAGMCAAADVAHVADLDEEAVDRAVNTLLSVMTSDAMFRKRLVDGKPKAFAASEMAVVFPNSPLCNPSVQGDDNKRKQYRARVKQKWDSFLQLSRGQAALAGDGRCFVDGGPAFRRVGNDEFPLVDSKSKRNFHPGLQEGHAVGALTALALEFFPLSVLRTGVNAGFFWFVHTATEKIAIACARMTLDAMRRTIARGEGLEFFGDWSIPIRDADAAMVALIRDLMSGRNQSTGALSWKDIEAGGYPVTAYVFSNDNRGPSIAAHELPHQLFRFFAQLLPRSVSFDRFNAEVLRSEHIGGRAAKRMLARQPIIDACSLRAEAARPGRLLGGWQAHAYYATEVLGMSSAYIRDVEAVAARVVASDNVADLVLSLQKAGAQGALLRLTRQGMMTFEEYTRLVDPDDRRAAYTARDYLLGAIYEYQSGKGFTPWDGVEDAPGDKHPWVFLAESVGERLAADADFGKKVAGDLAKSARLGDLRGAVLRYVRRGVISWRDFVNLFPPDAAWVSYALRDYLLAYLYTALRDPELPEPEPVAEKAAQQADES